MSDQDFEAVIQQLRPHLPDYLTEKGVDVSGKFLCFNPEHKDTAPSANLVGKDTGNPRVFCHGCLAEDELIWTEKGLRPIKDIRPGDLVITHTGGYERVTEVVPKQGTLLELSTDLFRQDPLRMTPDHTCIVLRKEEAIAKLPYIGNEPKNSLVYKALCKERKWQSWKYKDVKASLTECRADEVRPGDYIVFPITENIGTSQSLFSTSCLKAYTKGPKTNRILELRASPNLAYLYGLYIAEGSTGLQHVTWSFNINEKDTLAKDVQDILSLEMSLDSFLSLRPEKGLCEVICSKTDLARQLENWFGKGALNKKVPIEIITSWLPTERLALLEGWLDGDRGATISRELAYSMFHLAVSIRLMPSLVKKESYVDKKGITHKESWHLSLREVEGVFNFYENFLYQGETLPFYATQITEINAIDATSNVIDITVAKKESFLTKLGIVHNCSKYYDLFDCVHIFEDRPIAGVGWIEDTLKYLAKKYGVEVNLRDLTEEEQYELDTYRAYKAASTLLRSNGLVKENFPSYYGELDKRGWTSEFLASEGVGTVESYDSFFEALVALGFSRTFLKEIDLNRKDLFNPDNMIFTWRDEKGRPIGFTARNLKYETDKAAAEKKGEKYTGAKYNNQRTTGLKVNIFQKGKRLFGIDKALKAAPPLYIFEGQADCLTARKAGLTNCVALAGSAMRDDHIFLLRQLGIYDIILCLDSDTTGQKKMAEILETKLAGIKDMKVRLVVLPEGEDPDTFIRKNGLPAFKSLAHWSAFEWRLNQYPEDADESDVCHQMVPFIVSEPSAIIREKLCRVLSTRTGVALKAIQEELSSLLDAKSMQRNRERSTLIESVVRELANNPSAAELVLQKAQADLLGLTRKHDKDTLSSEDFVRSLDEQKKSEEDAVPGKNSFKLGQDLRELEEMLRGDWEGCLIEVGGEPNSGKSAFMSKVAYEIARNNEDVVVIYHTIDDTSEQLVPRFVSIGEGSHKLSINMVRQPKYWEDVLKVSGITEKRNTGYGKLRELAQAGRLIVKDLNHGGSLGFIENIITYFQEKYPERRVVFILDNFHKLRDLEGSDERVRFKALSEATKSIAIRKRCTIIASVEYTKMPPATRPTDTNIGECLTDDTLIFDATSGRYIPICDVAVGTLVPTLTEDQTIFPKKISKKFDKGMQEVYLVKTRTGKHVKTTMNHPFYGEHGWTKLSALEVGSWIGTPRTLLRNGEHNEEGYNPPLSASWTLGSMTDRECQCRFLGYMAGDGSYGKIYKENWTINSVPCFTNKESIYIEEMSSMALRLFESIHIKDKLHNGSHHISFSTIRKENRVQKNIVVSYLEGLGIHGQTGQNKEIPNFVFESSRRAIAHYLAGLFATDGFVSEKYNRIGFANKSLHLVRGCQSLLLRLGISSSISETESGMHSLRISNNSLALFSHVIPMTGPKGKRLEKFANKLATGFTGELLPTEFVKKLQKAKGLPVRYNDGYFLKKNGRSITREKALKLLEEISSNKEELENWILSDIYWDTIVSIESLGKLHTWDLEVEDTHNFVANNIFCHNTKQLVYDANAIIHLYNEVTSNSQAFTVCHMAFDWKGEYKHFPRVEFIVSKNKISEQKGSFFMDFFPASSDYKYVDRATVLEDAKEMKEGRKGELDSIPVDDMTPDQLTSFIDNKYSKKEK